MIIISDTNLDLLTINDLVKFLLHESKQLKIRWENANIFSCNSSTDRQTDRQQKGISKQSNRYTAPNNIIIIIVIDVFFVAVVVVIVVVVINNNNSHINTFRFHRVIFKRFSLSLDLLDQFQSFGKKKNRKKRKMIFIPIVDDEID